MHSLVGGHELGSEEQLAGEVVRPLATGVRTANELTADVRRVIDEVEEVTDCPVTMVDTGPLLNDMIDL